MTRHYCTLFDSRYLPQGLALYESLKKHSSEEFWLYALAMDEETFSILLDLQLQHVGIVNLSVIEHIPTLKASRTHQEFCWTMASHFTEFMMHGNTITECTYLDADLMFFSDPKVIHDEIGDRSIAVIPHRWNDKDRKRLEINGKFNVSWVTFKNNAIGRECLSTWARQCRERCSAKVGCGDQKYLDEWPAKYGSELCVIQNIGAGVAPWNLQNYNIGILSAPDGRKWTCVDGVPVVFYHYHEYRDGERLTNYRIRQQDKDFIYVPYQKAVHDAKQRVASLQLHGERA